MQHVLTYTLSVVQRDHERKSQAAKFWYHLLSQMGKELAHSKIRVSSPFTSEC